MLDELILGGEIQETSKKNVLKAISAQDILQEVCKSFLYAYTIPLQSLLSQVGGLFGNVLLLNAIVVVSSNIVSSQMHLYVSIMCIARSV